MALPREIMEHLFQTQRISTYHHWCVGVSSIVHFERYHRFHNITDHLEWRSTGSCRMTKVLVFDSAKGREAGLQGGSGGALAQT